MAKKKDNLKGSTEDIKAKVLALRENLRSMRFNVQGAKSKNVKEQGSIKKEIARLLTALNKNQ